MTPSRRPVLSLALVLVAFQAATVAAETAWVAQVKQKLASQTDQGDQLVTRCILTRATLECSFDDAIELADRTIDDAEKLEDHNAAAVALMLKSIALGDSQGLASSQKPYQQSCQLFDGECCAELRSLFWISRAKRELEVGGRQQLAKLFRRARVSAKESTNPMVRAIVAMEFTEFRKDRIDESAFAELKEHMGATSVPSMGWRCELKKLRSGYGRNKSLDQVFDRVAELAQLAEEDGSLDTLAYATRFMLVMLRNEQKHKEVLQAAVKLQEVGSELGSTLYTTVGLTNEAISHLRLGNVDEARNKIDEALKLCPMLEPVIPRRLAYATHVEICIESNDKKRAVGSLRKLARLNSQVGSTKPRFDSKDLQAELDHLLDASKKASTATDEQVMLLEREKQTALKKLSRLSRWAAMFACCFLAGFAAVLWRNHLRISKINRTLRDVNARLKDEIEVGEKNRVIRESLEQRVARVERMESLGLLAGGIAHDFNNLLVGVVCNAQLLQRPELADDVQGRCIEGILESAETATELSRKMLAYAGREPSARTNVDVVSLVKRLQPMFNAGANEGVAVECDFQLDNAFASVDHAQLEQILLNLVSNARDASEESQHPVVVRVGLETVDDVAADTTLIGRRTDGDEFVFIEVQDRGVGMPKEEVAKIFEPFYRTKSRGRGMGLAVVYGLVNRQDGLIRCSSELGVGTTMRVLLPQSDAVCVSSETENATPRLASSGTLVVIDDESGILDVISRAFEPVDWVAETFTSGAKGIEYILENRDAIDCVLLDVVMPEMGGKAIVDRLDELGIRVPIVMMSGFSNTNLNEFLTLPNVVLTMEKPFSVSELFEKVSRATFFVSEDTVSQN